MIPDWWDDYDEWVYWEDYDDWYLVDIPDSDNEEENEDD